MISYLPLTAATNYPSEDISAAMIGIGPCSDFESSTMNTYGQPFPLG